MDLRYWSHAAKLALGLLAQQRYLPGLVRSAEGELAAAWLPDLGGPADRARCERLVRAMPPLCRVMQPRPPARHRARANPANPPQPRDLLDGFLASAVDGAVRRWGGSAPRPRAVRQQAPALEWCELLLLPASAQRAPPVLGTSDLRRAAFYDRYRQWARRLEPAAHGGSRICFRPEAPSEGEGEAVANPDAWPLRFFLQASDDPSLLVTRRGGQRCVALRRRIGSLVAVVASEPIGDGVVTLTVRADRGRYRFAFTVRDGGLHALASGETRYLSTEVAGGFTGVYFALCASGNGKASAAPAFFDWFDYRALQ